jgi:agmatinase
MKRSRNIETFLGCDKEYEEAGLVIFGAPFDSTTSYRPGARFASKVMRAESYGLETYSPYQDKDLADQHIYDAGDLELPFGNPVKALDAIEGFVKEIYKDKKIPVMIGGEHLVTLAAVKAAHVFYPDLHILHFDAHTDLRQDYLGEKLSHSTVIRRVWDLLGDGKIFQFGIRSGEREEFAWGASHLFMNRFDLGGLEEVLRMLKGKPVYFTVDLDVLDPSVFPGTGTPEPGGIGFTVLHDAILAAGSALWIVGADISELAPNYDPSGCSTAVACKVLRELLLAIS